MQAHGSRRPWTGAAVIAFVFAELLCGFPPESKSSTSFAGGAGGPVENINVPIGTILPVSLRHGLSSKDAHPGQLIEGRVMQDVPLPNGDKIPAGAKILGTVVVSSASGGQGSGGKLILRFDKLEFRDHTIAVITDLRALAPFRDVQSAQFADSPSDYGSPTGWSTTVQIGGDIKYGVGGAVKNRQKQTVGKGVEGGVLVHVRTRPGSPCEGPVDGDDRLQALWVFSADSCGIYDMPGVRIVNAGRTAPLGEITLAKDKGELKIGISSGMLLRIVR
jgi:hypothetical protein